ncbi:MAG TPA: hypothetical protein PKW98_11455 [Candidatus Wallbacteria bacterium]|nr:MAG: hypothetical protein BWY32_02258 [bacterium ADurb.Bin243]HOD38943.1 hypothetical protein [Candidatus Wallbacteria bacterium]HPG58423.1 hypothetical protein [Candidatus Wallbacteria bacterium]
MVKNSPVIKKKRGSSSAPAAGTDDKAIVKAGSSRAVEKAAEKEYEALCPEDAEDLRELDAELKKLNLKVLKLHKLWFETHRKGLHLPIEHVKASFSESEFTNFLGEIFGGVFCKTKAIEEKMEAQRRELDEIDERTKEVEDEIAELKSRRAKILKRK